MGKQVFVSYSTRDKEKAEAICAALERAGMECWIAPRDLSAGSQWGGGIVRAIQECQAVVVVFSSASNDSPQVAREMELAVSGRRPLIPVRVENAMPTEDMQFFLGVSHWFDAYAGPIEGYLPSISAAVRRVLNEQRRPWTQFRRRLPQNRGLQIALAAVAVVAVALITANLMKPPNPLDAMKSPMAGRWRAELTAPNGDKVQCVLDVQDMGQATYSDDCPAPLTGASGNLAAMKGGVWAQTLYKDGDDTGTFLFQGGSAHGYAGAFKVKGGRLRTRDGPLGEVNWRRISNGKPMANPAAEVVPARGEWPLAGVPQIAQRAADYVHKRWKQDAILTNVKVEFTGAAGGLANVQTPDGGAAISFEFYSPSSQQLLFFRPGMSGAGLSPSDGVIRDPNRYIPPEFVDLPEAWRTAQGYGMQGKQLKEAQLENWAPGTSYGRARLGGLQWMIDSAVGERLVVPAGR
jgi:hypothetical protein